MPLGKYCLMVGKFENPLRKTLLPRQRRDCPESVALGAGTVAAAPPRESLRISSSSMLCCHGAPRIAHTDPGEVPSAQRPWSDVRRTRRCLRCFPLSHIPAWKRNNKIAPFFDFKNWCYFLHTESRYSKFLLRFFQTTECMENCEVNKKEAGRRKRKGQRSQRTVTRCPIILDWSYGGFRTCFA